MISGAYLGPLSALILRTAEKEGVISYKVPEGFTTKDLGDGLDENTFDPDTADILKAFVERTALFTAANLCAAVMKSGYGKKKPMLINADGTTFYKTWKLDALTKKYTDELLGKKGLGVKFTLIENSPTIGSAIGALSL